MRGPKGRGTSGGRHGGGDLRVGRHREEGDMGRGPRGEGDMGEGNQG